MQGENWRCGLGAACAVATMAASASIAAPVDPASPTELHAPNGAYRLLPSVKIPSRDGVKLAADIYLPDGPGPFPIILIRTPYNKNTLRPDWVAQPTSPVVDAEEGGEPPKRSGVRPVEFYVGDGYAVVIEDFRGRWESEGVFKSAKSERRDFEDTAKWLDAQPWSARRMGMWGCSYLGHAQTVAAVTDTPSLKAITPMASAGSWSSAVGRATMLWHYMGGAFEYKAMLDWYAAADSSSFYLKPDPAVDSASWARFAHFYDPVPRYKVDTGKLVEELPLIGLLDRAGLPPTDWNNSVSNRPESSYWYDNSELVTDHDKIYTPSLWIYTWNDLQPGEAIDAFNWAKKNAGDATARDNQYMIIGPGPHCSVLNSLSPNMKVGDLDLGDTRLDIWNIMLKWNDRWVKGHAHAIDGMPKVTYWLYGKNLWRTAANMPLPGTRYRDLYLSSRRGANSTDGDGRLSFTPPKALARDTFDYDPADPVPTGSTRDWSVEMTDQRAIEARKDVLVYTSEPLKVGLTVVGPVKMVLNVSSSAVDTDFTGKLLDVYPDGRAIQLQTGILRARYRDGFRNPQPLEPGQTYEITVDLNATANWFAPRHRIRLEVSSSNFPRFDRNMNTGGNNYLETSGVLAKNTVLSGPHKPSRLILPIAPD